MKVPTTADKGWEVEVIRLEAKEVADTSAERWSADGFRHAAIFFCILYLYLLMTVDRYSYPVMDGVTEVKS